MNAVEIEEAISLLAEQPFVSIEFLADNAPRLEAAFRPYIDKLKR